MDLKLKIMGLILKELKGGVKSFAIKEQKYYISLIQEHLKEVEELIKEKEEYEKGINEFNKNIAGRESHPKYNEYKIKIQSLTKKISKEEEKAIKKIIPRILKFIESDYFFNNINNEIKELTNLTINQVNKLPYNTIIKKLILRRISNESLTNKKIDNQTIKLSNLKKLINNKLKNLDKSNEAYNQLKALLYHDVKKILKESKKNIKKIIKKQDNIIKTALEINKNYGITLNQVLTLTDKGLTKQKIIYLIKKKKQSTSFNDWFIKLRINNKELLTEKDKEVIKRLMLAGKKNNEIEKEAIKLIEKHEEEIRIIEELSKDADEIINKINTGMKVNKERIKELKNNLEGFNKWVSLEV